MNLRSHKSLKAPKKSTQKKHPKKAPKKSTQKKHPKNKQNIDGCSVRDCTTGDRANMTRSLA
jgi:hypothetical protein